MAVVALAGKEVALAGRVVLAGKVEALAGKVVDLVGKEVDLVGKVEEALAGKEAVVVLVGKVAVLVVSGEMTVRSRGQGMPDRRSCRMVAKSLENSQAIQQVSHYSISNLF